MTVCYLIVCLNLLYSFDQAQHTSNKRSRDYYLRLMERRDLNPNNQHEFLAKSYSPFCNISYLLQLDIKQAKCSNIVGTMANSSNKLKNLMTYKILKIIPSPVIEAYRNKDEFHIGRDIDGNSKIVGCRVRTLEEALIYIVHPTKLVTIKASHKRVAEVYEDFIRLSFIPESNTPKDYGHWSTLHVRSNEAGDVMATVSVNHYGYDAEKIMSAKDTLKRYFHNHLKNITLYYKLRKHIMRTHDLFTLLYGKPYFVETLNGYKFQISPETVFPTNKFASEVLYDTVITMAKLKPNTTVLDICSNTGTKSIMVSKFVKRVVSLGSFPKAIAEATHHANENNIHNIQFLSGRVNDNLISVLESLNASNDVVALLNYRLSILGSVVVQTIRRSVQISRLVYISHYNYTQEILKNFVDLCSDDDSTAPPFRLTKVVPIDLLPQTRTVEYILLFEREPIGHI